MHRENQFVLPGSGGGFNDIHFFRIPFSTRQVRVQILCVLHFIRVSESRGFLILTECGVVINGRNKLALSCLLFVFGILICHLCFRKDVIMVDR